jgi:subtilisin-like proprotein convertase family protein
MKRTAGLIPLLTLIFILTSLTTSNVHADSKKHPASPGLQAASSWHEGRAERHAWIALDEAEILLKKEPGSRDNARSTIRSSHPEAAIIAEYAQGMSIRLPRLNTLEGHSARLKKFRGSSGIRSALPVFYASPARSPESKMVLTEQIIVQFPVKTSPKAILKIESGFGLKRIQSFPFAHNTFLYELDDPLLGLKISNNLQKSGSVNYAYPNWMRVRTKRSIPDDPLFANQWHLLNTGQSGGGSGEDVNIVPVWDTYRGSANELIALVDDGLEINHPDLRDNVRTDLCWDFVNDNTDTTDGQHGTSCAGVAAGRGFNSLGICGAAPNAGLVGHRISFSTPLSDTVWASALSRNNPVIDIYSNSWGPGDGGDSLDDASPLVRDALANSVSTGRAGHGNVYLWAGGNGGDTDNSNYDGFANSRYAIAVAASTNNGTHSSYSEKGANILVNAPSNGGTLSITTTDRTGSTGYASGDYTSTFGGTSSATPLVAGIVALMLQANPELTWRDVKNILAETAEKNDPTDSDWTTNGAGYHINHQYGFGRVDALAAVTTAITWINAGAEIQAGTSSSPNSPIPDNNATGVSDTITINDSISIEFVEVEFSADHTYWPDLEVVLVSPDGTESVLAEKHTPSSSPSGTYDHWVFGTVRHYGENSKGSWTLRVKDLSTGDTGTFQSWTLKLYGTQAPSISDISISSLSDSTATITWNTDQASDSTIQFGTLNSTWGHYPPLNEVHSSEMVTSHSLTIPWLTDNTHYFFRVGSTSASNNGPSNSPNATNPSEELTFFTLTDAPTITGISVTATPSTATINWTTDEPADSVVRYGPDSSAWGTYPSSVSISTLSAIHRVTITGLSELTTYFFSVGSTDSSGNGPGLNANSTDPSAEYQFTTPLTPPFVTGAPRMNFLANTLDISFSKTGMQGVTTESNYRFSPSLAFKNSGSANIIQINGSTYRLNLSSIARDTIYTLTLVNITDSSGNALSKSTLILNDDNNNKIADDWEASYGISNAKADPDNDGLSNVNEYRNGTLPGNADTDGDGLPDGWEVNHGLDPLDPSGENGANGDPDGDGWTNAEEYQSNTDPMSASSPIPQPPDVIEVHPHDGAGTTDTTRIPVNASFAVKLYDKDGINIKDPDSIILTIDDGVNPVYSVSPADTDVVRTVKLSSDEDSRVSILWVIYDRSREGTLGYFPYGKTIVITVEAKDRLGDWMPAHTYSFAVESKQDHEEALKASPQTVALQSGSSMLKDIYNAGFKVIRGVLEGMMIIFNDNEPVKPELGPSDEIPLLNVDGINAIDEVLNLQPPTVFNIPVRVFIPCPGYSDLTKVNVYIFDGSSWLLGCDGQGMIQDAALGWMVEGSRVDHPDFSPPAIEISFYHFSAVQAGSSSQPDTAVAKSGGGGGGGGCFIESASM